MPDKLAWNRVFTPFQAIANGSGVIDRRGVEQKYGERGKDAAAFRACLEGLPFPQGLG